MSAGIKANADGSAAIQVGGSDFITISAAGAVDIPQSLTVAGQSPSPQIQTQTILSGSGTWSKPTTGGYQWVKIDIWGGGGGGGRGAAGFDCGGGGGGAYNTITIPLSWLASSESYTVGAGGTGRSGTSGTGTTGGTSSFNISNHPSGAKTINAYGGGGGHGAGSTSRGGGGGGILSAGLDGTTNLNGGRPYIQLPSGTIYTAVGGSVFGGGSGWTSPGSDSYFGGGGGSWGPEVGGLSYYGGGGGGGTDGAVVKAGGTSVFGGAGGQSAINSGTASNGQTPAGGGGAAETGTAGNGGNGQIILTWW